MAKIIELNKKKFNLDDILNPSVLDKEHEEEPKDTDIFEQMFKQKQQETAQFPIIPTHDINNNPLQGLTTGEARNRRKVLLHVQRYIQNFPVVCEEWKTCDLKTKTKPELDNILEEIKLTVGNSNANLMGMYAYEQGLNIIESIGPMLDMNLKGLSNIALKDKVLVDCVKECSLEYLSLEYVKPHIRLGVLTAGVIMTINNMNKKNTIINNFLDGEINNNKIEKFKDL